MIGIVYCKLEREKARVKLGGIPPNLSSPTSAFRSAICDLGSTALKYRSGTFLLGSTIVKHGILTDWWIHVSAQQMTSILNEQQAEII